MDSCTRCGGEVPQSALVCMHCGAEFTNTPEYQSNANIQGITVLVVLIGAFIWWLVGGFE
jgi:uncharacterized membrane protein YvbJ